MQYSTVWNLGRRAAATGMPCVLLLLLLLLLLRNRRIRLLRDSFPRQSECRPGRRGLVLAPHPTAVPCVQLSP